MTGASTNPKKMTLKKDLTCMIDCLKVQTHLFVFNLATIRAFFALFGPFRSYLWSLGQVQKPFLWTYLCKQSTLVLEVQPNLSFLIRQHLMPFLHFI